MRDEDDGDWDEGGEGPEGPEEKLRLRHDGFTPPKQKLFIKTLSETGVVRDACRVAGISSTTAYRTKKRLPRFSAQWDSAHDMAGSEIDTLAWERGVTGIEEEVYYYGKFSHVRRKRSDGIFRMILMASNPEKYGRMGGATAAAAAERAAARQRMKEPWPEEENEEELAARAEEAQKNIMRKLDIIRKRMVRAGEAVELPNGRACSPAEAQAMGYEVTPTGDPEFPYAIEYKGPDFTPMIEDHGQGESSGAA